MLFSILHVHPQYYPWHNSLTPNVPSSPKYQEDKSPKVSFTELYYRFQPVMDFQCAKKVMSDGPGLEDSAVSLVDSILF